MEKSLKYKLIESNYLNVESQDKDRAEAEHKPIHSLSNPFSRPGGTILLPTAPAPMQKESSSGSLGLNLSQGYSQMYGGIVFNPIFSYRLMFSVPISLVNVLMYWFGRFSLQWILRARLSMVAGWLRTDCWLSAMPPLRPSTICMTHWSPALQKTQRHRIPKESRSVQTIKTVLFCLSHSLILKLFKGWLNTP